MEWFAVPAGLVRRVEAPWHAVLEAVAADVRLFEDPRARLAIRVPEQRVSAPCAVLEAVVDEACVTRADRGPTSLLAHSMAIAVFVSAEIGAAATWLALS